MKHNLANHPKCITINDQGLLSNDSDKVEKWIRGFKKELRDKIKEWEKAPTWYMSEIELAKEILGNE